MTVCALCTNFRGGANFSPLVFALRHEMKIHIMIVVMSCLLLLTSDVDIGFITIKYFKLKAHGRDLVGLNQIGGYAFSSGQ